MTWLYLVFLGIALILWLTTSGYLIILSALAQKRGSSEIDEDSLPEIAVVIPTLNEENLILEKLDNLKHCDYPWERMKIFFVDGGSSDETPSFLKNEVSHFDNMELICLAEARARPDQINFVLQRIEHEIVVFTDVDAMLDPSCFRELVTCLVNDSSAAIMGAFIQPRTPLLEERLYWWFQSHLWWLEGEVLSTANISGVCYACRRDILTPLAWDAYADDINVALSASARGHRVRICRRAIAEEVRVPQTASDLVRFRRKRGKAYLTELKRHPQFKHASFRWQFVNKIRLWHFLVTPKIIPVFLLLAVSLILGRYRLQVLLVLFGFVLSIGLALFVSNTAKSLKCKWWRLPLAAFRLAVLIVTSMFTMNKAQGA